MKKLLIVLFLFALTSCEKVEIVDNPQKETTVYIQNLPQDTLAVVIDNTHLYALENNEVKYHTRGISAGETVLGIIMLVLCAFFVGIIVGAEITES